MSEESKKFSDMTPQQKVVYIVKLVVFFTTFGWIFPRILAD